MAVSDLTPTDSEKWYFSKNGLKQTPSICANMDPEKELSYRQQAASLIQDIGQKLNVKHLVINTAIVYMHRFYMFHTFAKYPRNDIATCALFLSAKIEEDPRKLEHVIRVSHACLNRESPHLDTSSEPYKKAAENLVVNELLMLQTLGKRCVGVIVCGGLFGWCVGFEVSLDHPHSHVVKGTQLMNLSKELAQTAYFMATNSLHLTTMCLEHKPTTVACVCIHLACKWAKIEVPKSADGKDWWTYIDKSVTKSKLDALTEEFLRIFEKSPSKLRRKLASTMNKRPDKGDKTSVSGSSSSSSMAATLGSNGSSEAHSSSKGKTSAHASGTKSQPVSRQLTPQPLPKPPVPDTQVATEMPALPKLEPLVHTPYKHKELGNILRPTHQDTHTKSDDKSAPNGQTVKSQTGRHHSSHSSVSTDPLQRHRTQSSSSKGSGVVHHSQSQRPGEHHRSHSHAHRHHQQPHHHRKHSHDRLDRPHEKDKTKERQHHSHHYKGQTRPPGHSHTSDTQPSKKRKVEDLEPGEILDDDADASRPPPIPPLPPLPRNPPPTPPPLPTEK
ncbi:cyclin-T1-like isoform X2 [Corticium candelabrum]|uniref:cyclin-T1-like isoform X2 n=1 Tax=Corticium candelabrum TaxID=121492 RepID=UPI002E27685F|nr:cyclin-T1-like isoform X2 [Corticium candelabrum]